MVFVQGSSSGDWDFIDTVMVILAIIGFIFFVIGGFAIVLPEGSIASKPFKKFSLKFIPLWIISLIFAIWLHASLIIGTMFSLVVYMICLFGGAGIFCWRGFKAQDKK